METLNSLCNVLHFYQFKYWLFSIKSPSENATFLKQLGKTSELIHYPGDTIKCKFQNVYLLDFPNNFCFINNHFTNCFQKYCLNILINTWSISCKRDEELGRKKWILMSNIEFWIFEICGRVIYKYTDIYILFLNLRSNYL